MSEESLKKLKEFYDFTVENATDEDVAFVLRAIHNAAGAKILEKKGVKKEFINYDNPKLNKANAMEIRRFFEDFLANGSDDEALYLMDGINSLLDFLNKNRDKVENYVIAKKKAMVKKLEKEKKAKEKAN